MTSLVELQLAGLDERSARKALQDEKGNVQAVAGQFGIENDDHQNEVQAAEGLVLRRAFLVGDPATGSMSLAQ